MGDPVFLGRLRLPASVCSKCGVRVAVCELVAMHVGSLAVSVGLPPLLVARIVGADAILVRWRGVGESRGILRDHARCTPRTPHVDQALTPLNPLRAPHQGDHGDGPGAPPADDHGPRGVLPVLCRAVIFGAQPVSTPPGGPPRGHTPGPPPAHGAHLRVSESARPTPGSQSSAPMGRRSRR
jgi:hypothetical protein